MNMYYEYKSFGAQVIHAETSWLEDLGYTKTLITAM